MQSQEQRAQREDLAANAALGLKSSNVDSSCHCKCPCKLPLVHVPDCEMKHICYKKLTQKNNVKYNLNQKHKLGDFKACYFGRLRQAPTTNITQENAYDRLRPQAGCLH